jgi:hypothetical protein
MTRRYRWREMTESECLRTAALVAAIERILHAATDGRLIKLFRRWKKSLRLTGLPKFETPQQRMFRRPLTGADLDRAMQLVEAAVRIYAGTHTSCPAVNDAQLALSRALWLQKSRYEYEQKRQRRWTELEDSF